MSGRERCRHHESQHDPLVAEQVALERSLGGLRATQRNRVTELPVNLSSPAGVQQLLEATIAAVAKGQLSPTHGMTINALSQTALRQAELQSEIALIEAQKLALEAKTRGRTIVLEDSGNGTPRT